MKKLLIPAAFTCALALGGCATDAADNHEQGMLLYNEGEYEEATEYLLAAVAENNTKGIYYVDLGMNYLELEEYSAAKEAFDHAISIDDEVELAYRGLGIMCMEQELYSDAIYYFDMALEQVELNVGELEYDILQYRAEAELLGENYEDALNTYSVLIQLGVNVTQNRLAMGAIYLQMGDEELATECYNQLIEDNGQDVTAYFGVYNVLEAYGYSELGLSFLNKALEVEGDTVTDHLNRGKIYYLMENYDAAITELSYALVDDAEASLYIAFCYEEQGDYETAAEYYLISLNMENSPLTANYYAMCLAAMGNENHAWNVINTTMDSFPDTEYMQDLKWNEIILYERMGMLPSALTRILEYQEAYPDDPAIEKELKYLTLMNSLGDDDD